MALSVYLKVLVIVYAMCLKSYFILKIAYPITSTFNLTTSN